MMIKNGLLLLGLVATSLAGEGPERARDGKLLWKQKLGREHSASLVVLRDHVVFGSLLQSHPPNNSP